MFGSTVDIGFLKLGFGGGAPIPELGGSSGLEVALLGLSCFADMMSEEVFAGGVSGVLLRVESEVEVTMRWRGKQLRSDDIY